MTLSKMTNRSTMSILGTMLLVLASAFLAVSECSAQAFITTWKTDNPGTSGPTSITIPTIGPGYNYDVDWDNDGDFDEFGLTGSVTHDFGTPGTYTIGIRGDFPRIYFFNSGEEEKILAIEQWGDIVWKNMYLAFHGAKNLICNAIDTPNLSNVFDLSGMFNNATSFTGDLSGWDVGNALNMGAMFYRASNFNSDLSGWDVGKCEDYGEYV
jgi:surface protein